MAHFLRTVQITTASTRIFSIFVDRRYFYLTATTPDRLIITDYNGKTLNEYDISPYSLGGGQVSANRSYYYIQNNLNNRAYIFNRKFIFQRYFNTAGDINVCYGGYITKKYYYAHHSGIDLHIIYDLFGRVIKSIYVSATLTFSRSIQFLYSNLFFCDNPDQKFKRFTKNGQPIKEDSFSGYAASPIQACTFKNRIYLLDSVIKRIHIFRE